MTKTAEKPTITNNNNNKKQLGTTDNNQQQTVTTKKKTQKPPRNTKSHQELSKLQEPSTINSKTNHEEPL